MLLLGGYFKDERTALGEGGLPNAVSVSNSDIIVLSNNDIILCSEGRRGSKKGPKIVVILAVALQTFLPC